MKDWQRKLIIIMETCDSEILTEYCCDIIQTIVTNLILMVLKPLKKYMTKTTKKRCYWSMTTTQNSTMQRSV